MARYSLFADFFDLYLRFCDKGKELARTYAAIKNNHSG